AILLGDDNVLGNVYETASKVARVGGLQCGIGQTLTSAVRRDEVFEHGEPFTEVRRDWSLDDLTRRLGHQSAHTGELANLLLRSTSPGVGHDVDRVQVTLLVLFLQHLEHFVSNLFSDRRPDFDNLVVALTVGDGAIKILLLNVYDLLISLFDQRVLVLGNDHVIDADGQSCTRGVGEAHLLDVVEHLHRGLKPEAEVGIVHKLAYTLLLEQTVDERHALRQVIVEDHAAYSGVDVLTLIHHRLGVSEVLIVVRLGEIHDLARVAQTDRGERLDLFRFESEQHFVDVGESATLTTCARLGFGQVVNTKDHVLSRHGDRLTRSRGEDVVRCEHQHTGLNLSFR